MVMLHGGREVQVATPSSRMQFRPLPHYWRKLLSGDKMAFMLSIDRQRGTLLGLAVGDALGAAIEFKPPGTFAEVTGYRGGGPHRLAPGQWTDDTCMALALANSIASVGWDLNDQVRRYIDWYDHGTYSVNGRCFDIGITTAGALTRFKRQADARTSGDPSEHASGNGSIMRLAPVPIRYAHLFPGQIDELVRLLVESSLPTHASPQCLSACAYMGLILAGLIQGVAREDVLDPSWPATATAQGNPPAARGSRCRGQGQLPAEAAARDRRQRLRGQEPGSRPVGLPRRQGLPGSRAAGREPGRRRRHDRGRLRPACRGVLGRVGDSAGMAGRVGKAGDDREGPSGAAGQYFGRDRSTIENELGGQMATYIVFTRESTRDDSELATYSQQVSDTLTGHPVTVLAAYGRQEVIEGPDVEGVVILEFPTFEAAKAWYDSPAYREVREHRFRGADYRVVIVEGV